MRQRSFVILSDGVEDGRIGWLDDGDCLSSYTLLDDLDLWLERKICVDISRKQCHPVLKNTSGAGL